jgi:hypothetical protein
MEVYAFLTSALGGGTWSASCPSCFNPLAQELKVTTEEKESLPGGLGEEKSALPLPGIEPRNLGRPARRLVTPATTLFRLIRSGVSKYTEHRNSVLEFPQLQNFRAFCGK